MPRTRYLFEIPQKSLGIHHGSIPQGMSGRAEAESDSNIGVSGLGRISCEVTAKNFLTPSHLYNSESNWLAVQNPLIYVLLLTNFLLFVFRSRYNTCLAALSEALESIGSMSQLIPHEDVPRLAEPPLPCCSINTVRPSLPISQFTTIPF